MTNQNSFGGSTKRSLFIGFTLLPMLVVLDSMRINVFLFHPCPALPYIAVKQA
jgi:hypothetical protein